MSSLLDDEAGLREDAISPPHSDAAVVAFMVDRWKLVVLVVRIFDTHHLLKKKEKHLALPLSGILAYARYDTSKVY